MKRKRNRISSDSHQIPALLEQNLKKSVIPFPKMPEDENENENDERELEKDAAEYFCGICRHFVLCTPIEISLKTCARCSEFRYCFKHKCHVPNGRRECYACKEEDPQVCRQCDRKNLLAPISQLRRVCDSCVGEKMHCPVHDYFYYPDEVDPHRCLGCFVEKRRLHSKDPDRCMWCIQRHNRVIKNAKSSSPTNRHYQQDAASNHSENPSSEDKLRDSDSDYSDADNDDADSPSAYCFDCKPFQLYYAMHDFIGDFELNTGPKDQDFGRERSEILRLRGAIDNFVQSHPNQFLLILALDHFHRVLKQNYDLRDHPRTTRAEITIMGKSFCEAKTLCRYFLMFRGSSDCLVALQKFVFLQLELFKLLKCLEPYELMPSYKAYEMMVRMDKRITEIRGLAGLDRTRNVRQHVLAYFRSHFLRNEWNKHDIFHAKTIPYKTVMFKLPDQLRTCGLVTELYRHFVENCMIAAIDPKTMQFIRIVREF
jgi:hypothetical protein